MLINVNIEETTVQRSTVLNKANENNYIVRMDFGTKSVQFEGKHIVNQSIWIEFREKILRLNNINKHKSKWFAKSRHNGLYSIDGIFIEFYYLFSCWQTYFNYDLSWAINCFRKFSAFFFWGLCVFYLFRVFFLRLHVASSHAIDSIEMRDINTYFNKRISLTHRFWSCMINGEYVAHVNESIYLSKKKK